MTMEEDFNHFMECLMEAGERMDQHYFQIPIAGSQRLIVRERVYCYELYHQLRKALGDGFPYKLNGEVDKEGHPIIHPELGPKKPDFIVHTPGGMKRNLVVIEVKSHTVRNQELRKDIDTLRGFLDKAEYFRAIMLLYGSGRNPLPNRIISEVERLNRDSGNPIWLVWHGGPRERPQVLRSFS